jgi:transcriptional regulator GlxA family with amidase domain
MSNAYTIGIVVFDGVLTSEVVGPAEVFGLAAQQPWLQGTRVLLVGLDGKAQVRTDEGLRLGVDASIADDLTLDVLLVPGGGDMKAMQAHEGLNTFIRDQEARAQWLGSVCSGAFLLGSAGVLDGKRATTWFGGEGRLQAQFPDIQVVQDQKVVVDRRILTANGGLVSYQAALVLLGRLSGAEHAREIYESLGMDRLGSWDEVQEGILAQ